MRNLCRVIVRSGVVVGVIIGMSACAARQPLGRPTAVPARYEETPMPTVKPYVPTPEPTPAPLPTRPVGSNVTPRKGHPIGPVVTFFGAARADGTLVDAKSVDKNGTPTYISSAGSGFLLVIEVKPGESGFEPGRAIFNYVANDPHQRPDLEIESERDLGDGSPAVCDKRKPNIGGVPGVNPPSFAETQKISDAINDLGCRFETFIESESACTETKNGNYAFVKKDTMTQFCMMVARAWSFPVGDTLLSVRVRDAQGNPGPVKQMRIRRPPPPAVRKKTTK